MRRVKVGYARKRLLKTFFNKNLWQKHKVNIRKFFSISAGAIVQIAKKFRTNSKEYIETFKHLLESEQEDKLILAELMMLPSENYIGEQMSVIDIDAIHAVREFVGSELAKNLKSYFIKLYEENNHLENVAPFTSLTMVVIIARSRRT